jgi:hypothetical protein
MIRKPIHILALFLGLLVCSLEGQFKCVTSGMIPFGGGVVQPLVSTPQYDYTDPATTRQQLIIDERIHGTRDAPASGIGLMQKWEF